MAKDTGAIYFNKDSAEYGFMSNMHIAPFTVEGVEYKSTEHYFQAAKARHFKDFDVLREILDCDSPVKVKSFGKQVRPFDLNEWNQLKEVVMKEGNMHKYAKNPTLQEKLLATGDCHLAECNPRDRFWGIGVGKAKAEAAGKYPGKNVMGLILEDIRKHFRGEAKQK
ncbi:hypothetical protein COCC4DRAFT_149060 [Bipolaris maydis ATCC 48331]|uniref:NADAR domain-containing protein n=2 Tax=Cochliobolus heterostrophus TaxID=5016 RepID=M2TJK9_COCH5|nr:uncharacterized protein COCC4DRAFT_149060 [Bipolaris maydis ATCC 48331]EMD97630.1 hypothetical protein COCHEDRAFT_1083340 [Bipolaris maydis C5]KAJ5031735.1 hypothetical protein J3E73DRAFT_252710 [Bipolaris maydis]ENI01127.1 hypothetical protein COCC4DRAFT_149060 [Bipolaris maydis ATCC 48331]KAJ5037615.1 hypothetical protein J3E74DRAFT_231852 [Bipolaris maydis]KAJ5060214.1 hypothetical protein J3E74DRAFT_290496 [Bipolaris maydis]